MINKENLWFITLFSLILVLGVYYVTLADENLKFESIIDNSSAVISLQETSSLTALKVANDELIIENVSKYENIILDTLSSSNEINDAYQELQTLQENIIKTEELEKLILDNFNLEAFVKIDNDNITITIASSEHDEKLANNIITEVQKNYKNQMYITIKFA